MYLFDFSHYIGRYKCIVIIIIHEGGAGFSLLAIVVNHVNARARGLFLTFPTATAVVFFFTRIFRIAG